MLWLVLQSCRPETEIQAALFCLFSLMPRLIASCLSETLWDAILAGAAMPLGMLAAFVLRNGFEEWRECYAQPRAREKMGVMVLCLLLIAALGFFRIGPVNLGHLAAVFFTLVAAMVNGAAYGASAGLFCGLSLVLSSHDYRLIFPLCLCGLICGLRFLTRKSLWYVPVSAAACLLTSFLTPANLQPIHWLTGVIGSLLCALSPRRLREKAELFLSGNLPGNAHMENDFVSQRIAHMRDAVNEIARALPKSAGNRVGDGEALGALLCAQCSNRELCWERNRQETEQMLALTMDRVRTGYDVTQEEFPALEKHGCLRLEAIHRTAQQALIAQKKRLHRLSRAEYEQTLTMTHLSAMSDTLSELSALAAGQSVGDLQAAHIIRLALDELHLPARLCYARRVDGHLLAALEMETLLPSRKAIGNLLDYLDRTEDMQLAVSRVERGRVELEETPVYSAAVGTASLCAEQHEKAVCGDTCVAKRCEGGRLLMVLCDGMGHGEHAHAQSEKTLELLMLLLEAGYTRRQAITAVNGMMLHAGGDEDCFTTVDLCDVDLWNGAVICEKLGACPTWVVRGDHLKKVEASSLPLGILEEAIPCHAEYTLHSGDILLMMSDGVADAFRDEEELRHAIVESIFIQPQRMADALLRNALLASGDVPKDDMSVMVMLMLNRQQLSPSRR
ncbi:MAG: SpoIIE family protein phosphatase [Clostridia bacterium]|nr:SpoIIE family protein phosphatase [Clostridia bacterium]